MKKSLTERIADHLETFAKFKKEQAEKSEPDKLREEGLPKYLSGKTVSLVIRYPLFIATSAIGLGLATGIAAVMGEAMDHVPYINTAVPEAINQIAKTEYFHGNLDKLGAALGFLGCYLRRATETKKNRDLRGPLD
jgi:hypothetical protein